MNLKTKMLQQNMPLNYHAYIISHPFQITSQAYSVILPFITYATPLYKSISAFGNGAVAHVTYIDTEIMDYIIKLVFKFSITIILKILPKKTANMSSALIHEIKGQAFRFLKEKIKTARLALTDVTPVQL